MPEQRKYARVDVNIPVACKFSPTSTSRENTVSFGNIYDLSLGGMKVCIPGDQPVGQSNSINYFVNLPAPFNKVHGSGTVKWVYKDRAQERIYIGMEFKQLTDDHRRDIECIINELEHDNSIKH